VGSIFFPGALRRYRAGRKGERTIPWYQRIDLILCLIGLVFGLMFALSLVQKWVWSVLMNNTAPPMVNERSLNILAVAVTSVDLCWIALIGVLFFQMVKQIKQRRTDPPQTT